MCTLSVVSSLDGARVRLMINRDERRLRPVAQAPILRRTSSGSALWPTDPQSGGTWVGANERGLAFAVINAGGHRTLPGMPSRGEIVPLMVTARCLDEVSARWGALDTTVFAPFTFVTLALDGIAVFDSGLSASDATPRARAHVFSSSSLGDDLVEGPRRALLAELLRTEPDPWAAQSRFHQHAWPDRRHLSVMMSRVNACTVSCTEVIIGRASLTMTYRPIVEGWPAGATVRHLSIRQHGVRAA